MLKSFAWGQFFWLGVFGYAVVAAMCVAAPSKPTLAFAFVLILLMRANDAHFVANILGLLEEENK